MEKIKGDIIVQRNDLQCSTTYFVTVFDPSEVELAMLCFLFNTLKS